MQVLLAAVAAALLATPVLAQRTIRVPSEAPTIQAAINAASPGDTVLLAGGVYRGPGNKNLTMRAIDLTIRSEGGAANCVIDLEGDGRAMNFYQGQTRAYVIEGVTFRDGFKGDRGGAVWISGASPTFRDCIFENCRSLEGGAIFMEQSEARIEGSVFSANGWRHDDASGGAIYMEDSSPSLTACFFNANIVGERYAHRGAAICAVRDTYPETCRLALSRCRIEGHQSERHIYSAVVSGFGVRIEAEDCVFLHNTLAIAAVVDLAITQTRFEACALALSIAPDYVLDSPLDQCEFIDNDAIGGAPTPLLRFEDCLFRQNSGRVEGRFTRCTFDANQRLTVSGYLQSSIVQDNSDIRITSSSSNCLYLHNTSSAGLFGPGAVALINCTLYGNASPYGPSLASVRGSVYSDKWGTYYRPGEIKLVNCLLSANSSPLISLRDGEFEGEFYGSTATIAWSVVPSGPAGIERDPLSSLQWGPGNLIAEPLFASAPTGDLRLAPGSPGIDAGANAEASWGIEFDLGQAPRFVDDPGAADIGAPDPAHPERAIIDCGAYEFQGQSPCRADLDGDGRLTFFDFAEFQALYSAGDPRADFDYDGELTFFDLLAFQEAFAAGCP